MNNPTQENHQNDVVELPQIANRAEFLHRFFHGLQKGNGAPLPTRWHSDSPDPHANQGGPTTTLKRSRLRTLLRRVMITGDGRSS